MAAAAPQAFSSSSGVEFFRPASNRGNVEPGFYLAAMAPAAETKRDAEKNAIFTVLSIKPLLSPARPRRGHTRPRAAPDVSADGPVAVVCFPVVAYCEH